MFSLIIVSTYLTIVQCVITNMEQVKSLTVHTGEAHAGKTVFMEYSLL